jgi:hypothetical protein
VCVWGGVTGSFDITVLDFLHHKFWFIQFSGVSAEQITINTNNSKSITGVSNGVGNANMFGTPSSRSFLWQFVLFKQGLLLCLTFMYVLLSFCFYIEKGLLLEYLSGNRNCAPFWTKFSLCTNNLLQSIIPSTAYITLLSINSYQSDGQ